MIAIARKNLSSLFVSPNSFLCNSNVHFLFSTSRLERIIPTPEIYDVLVHKHKLSPELASLVASHSPRFRIPKNVDIVLSFLKENNFSCAQLEKMVAFSPRILGFTIEGLKLKLKVFQDLGISSEEFAKIMSTGMSIIHLSTANRIIPSLSLLKGLLGSNHDVARLVRRSSWFLTTDLENTLIPNVEILKSYGIPKERILHFLLYSRPRCFLVKPDIMRKSVDRALQIGVSPTSLNFIRAASVFTHTSEGIWEAKLQTLRDLGFSDNDLFTMFSKAPLVFALSSKKITKKIELLLATGKYNISNIVANPSSLGCSIGRLEQRLQILGLLESRNLIEKWLGVSKVASLTDDRFFDRFVRPYFDDECITKMYAEAKNR